ncbi:hypothetical protein LCGC14_2033540 [marine sediment metagenome]|uniref:Ubiquitin-like domain-containing protein n=1 Tax=marine sediment metagenome TaxID=412755 RepID=A0A0F9EU72_9ZZZZ
MGFDNEEDEGLEFDEDLEEDLDDGEDETHSDIPTRDINSKTPAQRVITEGKKISVYFMSTIGPGEKKQKLLIKTGNNVGDIKETVANLFGLHPTDFHLSIGGITMDEGSVLSDYNVADGDDILLIPASIAGKL